MPCGPVEPYPTGRVEAHRPQPDQLASPCCSGKLELDQRPDLPGDVFADRVDVLLQDRLDRRRFRCSTRTTSERFDRLERLNYVDGCEFPADRPGGRSLDHLLCADGTGECRRIGSASERPPEVNGVRYPMAPWLRPLRRAAGFVGNPTSSAIYVDWSQRDSNSRPSACHADALPTAPWPRAGGLWPMRSGPATFGASSRGRPTAIAS